MQPAHPLQVQLSFTLGSVQAETYLFDDRQRLFCPREDLCRQVCVVGLRSRTPTLEDVRLPIIGRTGVDEHGAHGELIKVRRTEVVVDPATEAGALPLLPT